MISQPEICEASPSPLFSYQWVSYVMITRGVSRRLKSMFVPSLVEEVFSHGHDSVEEEMTLEALSMAVFKRIGQGEESWV